MRKINKNFFVTNMMACVIDSPATYFANGDENFIILENGEPFTWSKENKNGFDPVVFYKDDLDSNLREMNLLNEDGTLKDGISTISEFDFIYEWCFDELELCLTKWIICDGEFDGNYHIIYVGDGVKMDYNEDVYSIIAIYAKEGELTFLISNDDDSEQEFIYLNDIPKDVLLKVFKNIF